MPLSRDYTAIKLWQQAKRDMVDSNGLLHMERFDLANRAIQFVSGQFYDLMSNFYMTEVPIVASDGAYEAGTTGTYTVLTRTLALQTPSRNIVSTDIGKWVAFRIGTTGFYGATIATIVGTSSFTVTGVGLPTVDGTLADVIIIGNTIASSQISLAGLRMMMTGQQIKLELLSSDTNNTVKVGTIREVDTFISSGRNRYTIVWALNGDYIRFAYGDNVTVGSLTLRYPKMADLVSADSSGVDIPDGVPIEIAILYLRGLMEQRLHGRKENNDVQMSSLVRNLYSTFGQEVSAEIVKEKVMALK